MTTQAEINLIDLSLEIYRGICTVQDLSRDADLMVLTTTKRLLFPSGKGCADRQRSADIIAIRQPKFIPAALQEYKLCAQGAMTYTPEKAVSSMPDAEVVIYVDNQGNGNCIYTRRPWSLANGATPVVSTREQALTLKASIEEAATLAGETLLPL